MPSINIADLHNAKADVDHIAELALSPAAFAVDRLGRTKDTVKGAIDSLKAFNVRGAFAAGTPYLVKDVYTSGGLAYVAVVAHVSTTVAADLAAGKVTVHQGATREELAVPSGAGLLGWIRNAANAVSVSVGNWLTWQTPSVLDFMTAAERADVLAETCLLDVSDAVQKALNYCLANRKNLTVEGLCRIDKLSNIDRLVDSTRDEFRIVCRNSRAGFWTSKTIDMFSSTLLGYGNRVDFPGSEFIVFDTVRFEASDNSVSCFVLNGDKFLRMRFKRCYFSKIRLCRTTNFFQSWYLSECNIRLHRGIFMEAVIDGESFLGLDGSGFDLHFTDNILEAGEPGDSKFLKLAGQFNGGDFKGNLCEGISGPFVECVGGSGVSVSGNYFEAMPNSVFRIGRTYTISFSGNRFGTGSDPAYWPIDCQDAYTVVSQGNFSEGNLFKSSGMQTTKVMNDAGFYNASAKGLLSFGDIAYNGFVSDDPKHAQQIDKIISRTIFMGLNDFSQGNVVQNVASMRGDGVSGALPTSEFNWYVTPGARATCRLGVKVKDSAIGELATESFSISVKGIMTYSPTGDAVSVATSGDAAFPFVQQLATTTDKNSQAGTFLQCLGGATTRLMVYGNGGIGSYQANNVNLSDERTKREITPLASYWEKWKALDFVTFRYIDQADPRPNIGLIAQQVESVAPEFVSNDGFGADKKGNADSLKTIFTTDLYHAMGKVIQELQARVEALEK